MPRGIYLPIIGDPRSFLNALRRGRLAANDFGVNVEKGSIAAADSMKVAGAAAGQLSADMGKVAVAAERSVKVQVAAELKRTARLREEIVLFNQMGAAAKRGSQEQILASNLSGRAQHQLSTSLGLSAKESERLRRSSGASNKEINRGFRGALAGSGAFRALGRSLAFASGGFLIFASAAAFVRNSIDAARDWIKTQRSLSAQFRASGQDLRTYDAEIETNVQHVSRLGGFTKAELTQAFVIAYRQAGNVTNALRIMGDAATVARGRNLPLFTSVLGLTKAWGGQTTALRRLGILVPTHAKGLRALEFVENKFRGQLTANTTAAERFHASLYNMEEAAGGVLLPTINKVQARLAAWLGTTKNQIFVQKQFKQILGGVGAVVGVTAKVVGTLSNAVGGAHNLIVLAAGAWVGFKVAGVAAAVAVRAANIASSVASVVAWRAAAAGTLTANEVAAAATAAAWKAALISTGFGALAVAAGMAAALVVTHWGAVVGIFSAADDQVKRLTGDFGALERTSGAASRLVSAKQAFGQAVVSRDDARAAVGSARAEERATRGTRGHARAVDQLRLAVANLAVANLDLTRQTSATDQALSTQRQRLSSVVAELAQAGRGTRELQGRSGLSVSVPRDANPSLRQYIANLEKLAQRVRESHPLLYAAARGLIAIADATHKIPSSKRIRVIVEASLHGSKAALQIFKMGPGGLLTMRSPFDQAPSAPKSFGGSTPTPVKPIKDFQKWLDAQFALSAAMASATTSQADDLRIAREEVAAIRAAIREHRLHGKELVAAYQELGQLNSQVAGDVRQAADFASRFDKVWGLAMAKASATLKKGDDLKVAKAARAWVQGLIGSGKLNRQHLTDAYSKLADLNGQIASAAQEAAQKAKEARDALRQKVEQAIGQIGQLFQGPVLAPTDTEIKQQLGVLPPTMKTINSDLRAQNAATAAWLRDIKRLIREGAPKQLVQELLAAGPEQALYVHRLATASKAQIKKYFKAYEERARLGMRIATVKMTARNVDLVARNLTLKGGDRVTRPAPTRRPPPPDPDRRRRLQTTSTPTRAPGRDTRRLTIDVRQATLRVRSLTLQGGAATAPSTSAATDMGQLGRRLLTGFSAHTQRRAPSLGRMTLTAGRVDLYANTVRMPGLGGGGLLEQTGSDAATIILQLDSDVLARATLPRHQRRAKKQIARVRGRHGGQVLALE